MAANSSCCARARPRSRTVADYKLMREKRTKKQQQQLPTPKKNNNNNNSNEILVELNSATVLDVCVKEIDVTE